MSDIERLSVEDYIPADEDILHADKRMFGITETVCNVDGRRLRLIELGGARTERRKWIHLLDDFSILFLMAIDECDHPVLGDDSRVRRKILKLNSSD